MTTGQNYSQLMTRRIRRVLLVCNNYDSFSLEEDGHIETQITQEYSELNLSNPPSFERVESTIEALERIKCPDVHYDLILTMFNVGELDVFDFSRQVKEISSDTPIVLLSSYSKIIYKYISQQDKPYIDYVFCWNNSTDLIIAIIKLLEDKLNAEHDVLNMGARAIM